MPVILTLKYYRFSLLDSDGSQSSVNSDLSDWNLWTRAWFLPCVSHWRRATGLICQSKSSCAQVCQTRVMKHSTSVVWEADRVFIYSQTCFFLWFDPDTDPTCTGHGAWSTKIIYVWIVSYWALSQHTGPESRLQRQSKNRYIYFEWVNSLTNRQTVQQEQANPADSDSHKKHEKLKSAVSGNVGNVCGVSLSVKCPFKYQEIKEIKGQTGETVGGTRGEMPWVGQNIWMAFISGSDTSVQ